MPRFRQATEILRLMSEKERIRNIGIVAVWEPLGHQLQAAVHVLRLFAPPPPGGLVAQNGLAPEFAFKIWSPFLEHLDHEVVQMWRTGQWADFCAMLPEYAAKGHGEGFMHDTAMLLGALGWSAYRGRAEIVTPYFGASGTGQINAIFPVTPQDGHAIPAAMASAASGYQSFLAASRL